MLKKIVIRLLLITVILAVVNLLYNRFLYTADVDRYADALDSLQRNEHATVLYFGESSNVTYFAADSNKRSIASLISGYFPGLEMNGITKYASHARTYLYMIRSLPADSKVQTVIMTMNLRSFGAGWINSELENQLALSNVFMYKLPNSFKHLLGSLRFYDYKTPVERDTLIHREWHRTYAFPFETYFKSTSEWDYCTYIKYNENGFREDPVKQNIRNVACHYIKNFAFTIDPEKNPRIKDYDEIVKECSRRNIQLVLNILPENVERGDSLVGKELVRIMKYNAEFLTERYTAKGARVVNSLEALPASQFLDSTFTAEHYKELGRKIVARSVALQLKELYPDKFKEIGHPRHFYNDFEAATPYWPQPGWLTEAEYVSPGHSNEISSKGVYSGTFCDYIFDLADNKQQIVSVKLKYKGPFEKRVRLCFMKSLDSKIVFWNETYFDELKKTELKNGWYELEQTVTIPERKYSAERLTIFVTNLSGQTVFIDDMDVSYK